MSEQTNTEPEGFGIKETERRQGFEPMPMAHPDPPKDFADGPVAEEEESFGPREAAAAVAKRREQAEEAKPVSETEPLNRSYINYGGEKPGELRPAYETVPIDRAARDLAGMRDIEETIRLQQLEADLVAQLDAGTADRVQEPQQQPQQQPQEQPQSQPAEPALEGDDVWQNPKVIAAVSEYANQVNAGVEAFKAQTAQELAQAAASASASVLASFPELANVAPENLAGAVQMLNQQNPERGEQLRRHVENVNRITAQAQQAQQAQVQAYQQQHRQQFDYVAKFADDAFDRYAESVEPDASRRQEISGYARTMLREGGMSDAEINYHWQSSPILRSALGQQILFDAARLRIAQQAARGKARNPVPTVQRPGSPISRGSDQDWNLGKLESRLNQSGSAKDAAALLTARRGARR